MFHLFKVLVGKCVEQLLAVARLGEALPNCPVHQRILMLGPPWARG